MDITRVNGSQNPRNATSKADIYSVPSARIPIHRKRERETRGRVNGSQNPRNATSKADIYSVPLARIPIKS